MAAVRSQGLYRQLRRIDCAQGPELAVEGRRLFNFSSNDYLGLANEPALREAAVTALEQYGVGSGSARLICGSLAPHEELEQALAELKGTAAAVTFSTGYATALGTIPAAVGAGDVVVLDKLAHACLVDAARLSGATLRVFPHNDLNKLEHILRWAAQGGRARVNGGGGVPSRRSRVLIVTESIFSMDGDCAPLVELTRLKERYGAWLMVDEAHATGLYGTNGCGVIGALGLTGQVEIQMGTLGKALGAAGGFICGSRTLIDYLVNRARSFIFSTAPPPAVAVAAAAAVRFVRSPVGEQRRAQLWARVAQLRPGGEQSAIVPIIIGGETQALDAAHALFDRGFLVPAIRYPTVARGTARLRITLTAAHAASAVDALLSALKGLGLSAGLTPRLSGPSASS